MDYVISILPQMWEGTLETIRLFAITIVLSIPLGVLLALGRVSGFKALRDIIGVYVWLLRGTPLMLQLLFVYYGLPFIPGIGVRLDDFPAAVFAFVLNYAAYFCEIFRAGIQAVPKGQYEAAHTLGMNYVQTMRRIVLPQVFRLILPPVSNETITLVKDTSLRIGNERPSAYNAQPCAARFQHYAVFGCRCVLPFDDPCFNLRVQ